MSLLGHDSSRIAQIDQNISSNVEIQKKPHSICTLLKLFYDNTYIIIQESHILIRIFRQMSKNNKKPKFICHFSKIYHDNIYIIILPLHYLIKEES